MRFHHIQTGTKIFGAFAVVSLTIVLIACVALWRMYSADATTWELVDDKLARVQLTSELLGGVRLNGVRALVEDVLPGLITRCIDLAANAFSFQQLEEALGDCVIVAVTAPAHALHQVV